MKKVSHITLSGMVFVVEEDAYVVLEVYLKEIQVRLAQSDDQAEIMTDIESAMAEKLSAAGKGEKRAVTLADVEHVQSEMGAPDVFGEEVMPGAAEASAAPEAKRRLFRDADDAVIAGVASGLARYFAIDPVIVRIVFVVLTFANGIGLLAYLVLWLAVPKAETTAQKFAMRGQKVTLEDIAQTVKKNLHDSKVTDPEYVKGAWSPVRTFLQRVFVLLGLLLDAGLKVVRFVAGIGLVFAGAIAIAGLFAIYGVVLFSDITWATPITQEAFASVFGSVLGLIALGSLFVVLLIPLLAMIVLGVSVLRWRNVFTTNKSIVLVVVWIIAFTLTLTAGAITGPQVYNRIESHIEHSNGELEVLIDENGIRFVAPVSDRSTPHSQASTTPTMPGIPVSPVRPEPVFCTMDAKQCPDGTFVGRSGPDCSFTECPGE